MEDKVLQTLHEICEADEKSGKNSYCTSEQCRLDVACYVLNRIPQRYVTSGRGFAYLESDYNDNPQLQVDVVTLCHEGLRRVTSIRRSFYTDIDEPEMKLSPGGVYFDFPLIKGRVLNGITFSPVINVDIEFRIDGKLVQMLDSRWPNPYSVVDNTPGTYLFWPKPIPSDKSEVERSFEVELQIKSEEYEPFVHFFNLTLRSGPLGTSTALKPKGDLHLQDLFLIPAGIDDPMQ